MLTRKAACAQHTQQNEQRYVRQKAHPVAITAATRDGSSVQEEEDNSRRGKVWRCSKKCSSGRNSHSGGPVRVVAKKSIS